jgi:hypothetical protein
MTRLLVATLLGALAFSSPEPRAHVSALRAATAPPREEAKAAFDEGKRAFDARDFPTAVEAFRRADQLAPHDDTRFNLALALEMAGDLPAAWHMHRDLSTTAESPTLRRECTQMMRRLERRLALLTVRAMPTKRLCVDGTALYADDTGQFVTATAAGSHTVAVDDAFVELDLELGRHHVLDLAPRGTEPKHPRLVDGLVAGAAVSGLATIGLGIGTVATDDPTRTALGATTIVTAASATSLAIAALVIHLRQERARTRPAKSTTPANPTWNCPND